MSQMISKVVVPVLFLVLGLLMISGCGQQTSGSCTACHGVPPAGTAGPNRAGAHPVHNSLTGVVNVCGSCHSGAGDGTANHRNGTADGTILSSYNAKNGAAARNADATCANVSCHGGKVTPVWFTGTIDVNTECSDCHAFGSGQYNSFSSGEHDLHVNGENISCTACHGTAALTVNHFTSLNTPVMEGPASATINGQFITSYSNGSCTTECHEPRTWQL